MATPYCLTLIRHLPTKGNREKQYIGWTDELILPVKNQKISLNYQPETVYGSDLKRCRESAKQYFPTANYVEDLRFRETNFGDWEGKTYKMLKEIKTYRDWIDDPFRHHPPNGETVQQVEQRVVAALYDLPKTANCQTIVTHGGPIRIVLTKYDPNDGAFWSWRIPHHSIWQLEWASRQDFEEGKRCVSISEVPITAK